MSPLDSVRAKAEAAGFMEAMCGNCGLFEPGDGLMGTCRRRRETQFRNGVCLGWTVSNIAPPRTQQTVAPDGSKPLFPGVVAPKDADDDRPPGEAHGLRCAEDGCGGDLVLRWSGRLEMWFYGCLNYPRCQGTLPANDDGSPRGEPRTKELQGWRNRAHAAFDRIWKDGHCSRGDAYSWLRAATQLSHEDAHMVQMSIQQCQQVIRFVDEKGPGTAFWTQWKQDRTIRKREKRKRRRSHTSRRQA